MALNQLSLAEFYKTLQTREQIAKPKQLIGEWDGEQIAAIHTAVERAFERAGFDGDGMEIPEFERTPTGKLRTNQSKGNVAADFVTDKLTDESNALRIRSASGYGYPDTWLTLGNFTCACEIKSTSEFKEGNGNRCVLTSSTAKLRKALTNGTIPEPPNHLLLTVEYHDETARVRAVRLNFLQPETTVNVRYEASTSGKLLTTGKQPSFRIASETDPSPEPSPDLLTP